VVVRPVAVACVAALLAAPAATAEGPLPGGRAIVVKASVSPDTHLFADPVVARVDVVLDPKQFDPGRIRVNLGFEPYELVGSVTVTRHAVGALVEVRYTAVLRCLHVGCIAARFQTELGEREADRPDRYAVRFQPAEILYQEANGRSELLFQRPFPPVEVVSRLNAAQAAEVDIDSVTGYRASVEPPPPTYRAPPRLLASLALAAALLMLAFPAALAGRALHERWRASRRPRPLSPLERALLLIAWTAQQPDGDERRRKALEALALVAEHGGAASLAEATREVAWDRELPGGPQAEELAARAATTLTGGGNGRPA
jgi:hypothetical protein